MAHEKPSPKILSELRERLAYERKKLDHLKIVAEGRETPFWASLKWVLEQMKETNTSRIDRALAESGGDPAVEWANAKLHYGGKEAASAILDSVEASPKVLEAVEIKISNTKARIKVAEEQLAQLQPAED